MRPRLCAPFNDQQRRRGENGSVSLSFDYQVLMPALLLAKVSWSQDQQRRNWSDYPSYALPKPTGPFRNIAGTAEYMTALREKEVANKLLRNKGFTNFEVDVHEIHPVFLSEHPTSTINKLIINRKMHSGIVTPWWARKATEAKRLHETMLRF